MRVRCIKIYIGSTGRYLQFGPVVEEDELRQLRAWRHVVSTCLDTLSAAIAFGHFMADMEAVYGLPDAEQPAAARRMVAAVQARGGLLWERQKVALKGVEKVFKDTRGTQLVFGQWRLEAAAFASEAEAALAPAATPAVVPDAQESRLAQVGAPNVQPEHAPATDIGQLLNGMDRQQLARLEAALAARLAGVVQADLASQPDDRQRGE